MSVGARKFWSRGWLYVVAILLILLLNPIQVKAAIPKATDGFFVNDYAEVLSDETETEIKNKNYDLEEKSGAQIVVVTVDSSDGEPYEEYAADLFNEWGIGSSKLNNGFLLVLFIEDDDYYAIQGKGIEKVITNNKIQDILYEKLEPYFAEKDYDKGVKAAFDSFYDVVDTYYDKNPVNNINSVESQNWVGNIKTSVSSNIKHILKWIAIIIGFIVFLFIITLPNRWGGRRTTSYDSYSYGSGYGRRRRRHHHHHMPPPPPRHHHHGHRSSFGGGPHRGPSGPGPSSRGSSVGHSAPSRSSSPSPSRSSGRSTGVSSGGGGSARSGSGAGRSSGGAGRSSSGAGRRK